MWSISLNKKKKKKYTDTEILSRSMIAQDMTQSMKPFSQNKWFFLSPPPSHE